MSNLLSAQSAIYLVNNKVMALETTLNSHMKQVEAKFGAQDAFVTDNIPDMDLVNRAIMELNKRIIDLEALNARVCALEAAAGTLSVPSKKRGTVKLEEAINPTAVSAPGISFS
jgi:hypothetical protein